MTAQQALQKLKDGNKRFTDNKHEDYDLLQQVEETKNGQEPFAVILSCMDSRASAELIFDQGIGHVFSVRVAGNVISEDALGSIEYAVAAAGSKLIVVLGHTGCGAVKGACDGVELGNLTSLLAKIKPAVEQEKDIQDDRSGKNAKFVNAVSALNIHNSVSEMLQRSPVIKDLVESGQIGVAPAMYDISNGKVTFYDDKVVIKNQNLA